MADPRDEEIAELRRQLAERDVLIARLLADVARQSAEIAALKELLGRSSKNSSKPPSSDGPGTKPRRKKPTSARKPGGQPGHKKHHRELVPLEEVQEVIPCIPTQCEDCGKTLHGQDAEPHRHQVVEVPVVKAVVTEYQQHGLDCA